MRARRPKHSELSETQKHKANCRAYTGVLVKRGKILKESCSSCGATSNVEAHHLDYNRPKLVHWLCRKCHKDQHKLKKDAFGVERFESYVARVRTMATAGQYGSVTRKFLKWSEKSGVTDLKDAPMNLLANYCAHLIGDYKPSSVRLQIVGVQRYLKWCREGGRDLPDFFPPEIPKYSPKMRDVLRESALLKYFEVIDDLEEPTRTAALLLPCCGLRVNEMAGLLLDNIQSTAFTFKGQKKRCVTIFVKGKGGRERSVPLLDEGRVFLTAYLRGWRSTMSNQRWLFPTDSTSGHVIARTLRAALQKARGPLKMTFTPHTMRRTYLTELYRRGVEPTVLMKIAGHANMDTLIKHYLALDDQDVVRAVHATGGRLMMEERT
jgi:site-specific recombinase XerD/ribosomal protein S27AE